ncbi:putative flagellar basal body P-ring protein [Magnetofaba australis IT-1]|uniref:Flagellar P-ring protein n=1 Tax=Magnetofaba australis IT-1 TaxID=1434232 RepID=A0A1Y2K427_9PROT|nr:putative flagellar basal body P-ring protein [Magnetofaba australis IT-1]
MIGFLTQAQIADAARLKDVVTIEGVRGNPLSGFGLVVGLNGSGDSSLPFTSQAMRRMLSQMGISISAEIKAKNVAGVMVTTTLPPFARQGSQLDVTLSSVGDAKSLQGGTLIMTPLRGADGRIYAVSQGALSIGGFSAGGAGQGAQKNHPTVARIANGAIVEREINFALNREKSLELQLRNPDFTTANRIVRAINGALGQPYAKARDSGAVDVRVPKDYQGRVVDLLTRLETLQVEPDQLAKVVVSERTGTIVMGENVRVSTVALSHGNLSIKISSNPQVSQPNAMAGGQTAVTNQNQMNVTEQDARLIEMQEGVTLNDLVKGLNGVGVTPRDLIAILQTIKTAGALQADLVIQ